jgi:predicted SAM-dependent methyltransferase
MRKILLNLFSHRTLALLRWDIHFMQTRMGNWFFSKNSVIKAWLKQQPAKRFLNLGSGPRGIIDPNWFNIDGFKDKNVQFVCDFNKPLPFPDNLFDGIFCEHVLEHFDYDHGTRLMKECLRVLKPGGVVRIIVPNGKTILKSYFDDPAFVVKYKECKTKFPMEAVNTWFYQRYEHQCIYDADYLTDMLLQAGYSNAKEASYQHAVLATPELLLDDPKYNWESLYVEAAK